MHHVVVNEVVGASMYLLRKVLANNLSLCPVTACHSEYLLKLLT